MRPWLASLLLLDNSGETPEAPLVAYDTTRWAMIERATQ